MPSAGFESVILPTKLSQTYDLDSAATRVAHSFKYPSKQQVKTVLKVRHNKNILHLENFKGTMRIRLNRSFTFNQLRNAPERTFSN
jgi:hypothetical protein